MQHRMRRHDPPSRRHLHQHRLLGEDGVVAQRADGRRVAREDEPVFAGGDVGFLWGIGHGYLGGAGDEDDVSEGGGLD